MENNDQCKSSITLPRTCVEKKVRAGVGINSLS